MKKFCLVIFLALLLSISYSSIFADFTYSNSELIDSNNVYFSFENLKNYNTILLVIEPETGTILEVSQGAFDFYGYSSLEGMNISEINQLSEIEVKQEMAKAKSEERNFFEFVHKLANDELRDVEVNSYPMQFQGKEVLVSRIMDVTERNKQEALYNNLIRALIVLLSLVIIVIVCLLIKIRINSIRYRKLFENINSSVAIYKAINNGEDFVFASFNPAAEKTDNICKQDVIGKKVTDVFPNIKEMGLLQLLQNVNKTGESEYLPIKEYRDERISGWRENYIYKLPNNEVLVVYEDITERKQLQEGLELAKEEAEKAKEEAEKASKAKSDFLSNMSHELRTPLNGVQGFVQLLMDIENDNEKKEYLGFIDQSAKNLLEIVESILLITKIEKGKLTVKESTLNAANLTALISNSFEKQAKVKALDYYIEIDSKLDKKIVMPKTCLFIVIHNLLSNAIKFTHQGLVRLSLKDLGASIEICVSDTGVGINVNQKNRLFSAFEQGEHYLTKQFGGIGVGLAIVKGVLDLVNGKIKIESEENKGTTFTVIIPYKEEDSLIESDATLSHNVKAMKKKLKIISAEDVPSNQLVIAKFLEKEKINLKRVANGKELIEELENNVYDLILMDIQMPMLNGIEATKIIKNDERFKHIPIIAVSAYAFDESIEKMKAAGVNDYISKPIKKQLLIEKIIQWGAIDASE